MALIGLSNLYYATLTTDPATGKATYAIPVHILGAMKADVKANASKASLFGDNGPMETATSVGQIELSLGVTDLTLKDQAALLGHTTTNGILVKKAEDMPPYVAVGFKTLKSTGKSRYVWLVKGRFMEPDDSTETKKENVAFQTPTITGLFVKRDCDDVWELHADEDDAEYKPSIGTAWFTSVYDYTTTPA